ncbi:MAG: flagellar biosynthesis protein FlhB, partial [Pseudomonadales bacterium]|nr:flagellar biosynthesis protein FlhB [Pseudomonadales bacterium]
LAEARKDGNVARSTDLTAALVLLVTIIFIYFAGRQVFGGMRQYLNDYLTAAHAVDNNPTRLTSLSEMIYYGLYMFASTIGPILLAIFAISLVATVSQVGFLITTKPLEPNIGRMNPLKGIANLFNARSGVRLSMSLLKVFFISVLAILLISMDLEAIIHMSGLTPRRSFPLIGQLIFSFSLKIVAVLLILAIIDFAFQKWQRARELRMSKQEVKEEMKAMEGDPMIKQRRAQVAKQLAMQRLSQAVPTADVIVTNPTHFAVALKYDSQNMRAPTVVAKGADFMAMRIRQIANLHDIPIVERKPLARALFSTCDIGHEIPAEHYAAVAEILAYVYRISEGAKQPALAT